MFIGWAPRGPAPRRKTATQADIDNGIVNIMVGFAPLRPAEFVVLTIRQIAGGVRA
ncbi:hypothetical protein [Bradyrhizobium sp.]|uniref:hypothetical protein n=1 Tax=Bradyrhizobium sp. TaxID=376 RepID=UPI003C742ECD